MTTSDASDTAGIVTDALFEIMTRNGLTPPDRSSRILELPFEDFKLDSMDKLEFVMAIEERLARVFDANDIVQCRTLGDIVALAGR